MKNFSRFLSVIFLFVWAFLFVSCSGNELTQEDFSLEYVLSSTKVLQGEDVEVNVSFKCKKKLPVRVSFSGSFLKYSLYNDNITIPDCITNDGKIVYISNKSEDFKIVTDSLETGEYYFYAYVQFERKGQQFEIKTEESEITII